MPSRLVILSRLVAFAFFGDDMQDFRTFVIFYFVEDTHQVEHIVSICRTKIAQIESLEDIALLSGYQGFEVIGEPLYHPLVVFVEDTHFACQAIPPPTPTVVARTGGQIY